MLLRLDLVAAGIPGLLGVAQEGASTKPAVPVSVPGQLDEAVLAKGREKKLASEFLRKADWIVDYDRARAEAKRTGRLIFAYFTRSFAPCPHCSEFERHALSDGAFPEFAKRVVLFLHITSRLKSEPYPDLLRETGGVGCPHVVFLDANGAVVARHEGNWEVDEFRKTHERAQGYVTLRARADAGDRAARVDLLVATADFGTISLEEARAEAKAFAPLPVDERAKVDGVLATLELAEIVSKRDPPGPALVGMWKERRIPWGAPNGGAPGQFFATLARHAERTKDVILLEELAAYLKERYASTRDRTIEVFVADIVDRAKKLRERG